MGERIYKDSTGAKCDIDAEIERLRSGIATLNGAVQRRDAEIERLRAVIEHGRSHPQRVIDAAGTDDINEIVHLIEAGKRLPKTKDGVRVVPDGDLVLYSPRHGGARVTAFLWSALDDWRGCVEGTDDKGMYTTLPVNLCCSTREAAEAGDE
jgi:hypothetical protein